MAAQVYTFSIYRQGLRPVWSSGHLLPSDTHAMHSALAVFRSSEGYRERGFTLLVRKGSHPSAEPLGAWLWDAYGRWLSGNEAFGRLAEVWFANLCAEAAVTTAKTLRAPENRSRAAWH